MGIVKTAHITHFSLIVTTAFIIFHLHIPPVALTNKDAVDIEKCFYTVIEKHVSFMDNEDASGRSKLLGYMRVRSKNARKDE